MYPKDPKDLMYLIGIDNNDVLYKYENNPSTYQTHIDSIRDIVVEGKSSVNDKRLEGIVASLFQKKSVAPVKEEVKLTKEIVKEKWGLPAKEKREWLDSLNEKDYQFAVTEMANISVDAVSEPKKETPAESKSDLEYLNELLATSNDLLDLISDTGSKADINFLKEKIEATKDLISLLQ